MRQAVELPLLSAQACTRSLGLHEMV